jgi:hypothetical protein
MVVITKRIMWHDVFIWLLYTSTWIAAFTLSFRFYRVSDNFDKGPIGGWGDLAYLLFYDAPTITGGEQSNVGICYYHSKYLNKTLPAFVSCAFNILAEGGEIGITESFKVAHGTWKWVLVIFGWLTFCLLLVTSTLVLLNLLIAMMAATYNNVTEQPDLEFKMQRAVFLKYYSKEAGWLPPPFLTIGLLSVVICENCPCFNGPSLKKSKQSSKSYVCRRTRTQKDHVVPSDDTPSDFEPTSRSVASKNALSTKHMRDDTLGLTDVGNGASVHWAEHHSERKRGETLFRLRQVLRDFKIDEKERHEQRKDMRDFMAMQQAGKQAKLYKQLQDIEFAIPNKVRSAVEQVAADHNDYSWRKMETQLTEETKGTHSNLELKHQETLGVIKALSRQKLL